MKIFLTVLRHKRMKLYHISKTIFLTNYLHYDKFCDIIIKLYWLIFTNAQITRRRQALWAKFHYKISPGSMNFSCRELK